VRETVSNSYFERNGFKSMDGKCGSNCFDGVYIKGDQVIVNEVKPLNADGSIKLSPAQPSGLPTQGTLDWVKDRAQALIDTKDPAKVEVGKLIQEADRAGKLTTTISGVNSNGMVIVKVKP
jgi:filamentous hemagglutinin